jgi:hypothetical protein
MQYHSPTSVLKFRLLLFSRRSCDEIACGNSLIQSALSNSVATSPSTNLQLRSAFTFLWKLLPATSWLNIKWLYHYPALPPYTLQLSWCSHTHVEKVITIHRYGSSSTHGLLTTAMSHWKRSHYLYRTSWQRSQSPCSFSAIVPDDVMRSLVPVFVSWFLSLAQRMVQRVYCGLRQIIFSDSEVRIGRLWLSCLKSLNVWRGCFSWVSYCWCNRFHVALTLNTSLEIPLAGVSSTANSLAFPLAHFHRPWLPVKFTL